MKSPLPLLILSAGLGLSGCSSRLYDQLPRNEAAYAIVPPADPSAALANYQIKPGDEISISVFQEPDLSVNKLPVDEGGHVQIPLIGDFAIANLTAAEASKAIEQRLAARFLRNPNVTVNILANVEQTVSVEGQVMKPGVFPITKETTLLSALAQAQSTNRIAKLDEIVIFRKVNGQRLAARFDLELIRAGRAPDPQILGGDVVMVGFSSAKAVYRDILTAAPLFNLFTQF